MFSTLVLDASIVEISLICEWGWRGEVFDSENVRSDSAKNDELEMVKEKEVACLLESANMRNSVQFFLEL